MSTRDEPRPVKLVSSFKSLSSRAVEINAATKQLSSTVKTLEEALARLNLGITAWVQFGSGVSVVSGDEWAYELGHAKINGKWGLAIRHVCRQSSFPETDEEILEWAFADASRELRISAIDHVPELIDKLSKDAEELTVRLKRKTEDAVMLAKLLNTIEGADPAARS